MENIKSAYIKFDELIEKIGEDTIKQKIEHFMKLISSFIISLDAEQKLCVNDSVLTYCIMDCFSDLDRLMEFHHINQVNEIKNISYEAKWFLRRKPIQIISDFAEDDNIIYANEKFILTYIMNYLIGNDMDIPLNDEAYKKYKTFVDDLYYHLKYRNCEAQILELMMISFKSGVAYGSGKLQIKPQY